MEEKIFKSDFQVLGLKKPQCVNEGTENAIGVIAVSSVGEIQVITIINRDDAAPYYVDDGLEYMDEDFTEDPGIYLVEFKIDGSGPDYCGEYDSWMEIINTIKYKIDIADKRKDKFDDSYFSDFKSKIYKNPGSEYPRCLFVVGDDGNGFILDILNEDEAYKSVIEEMIGQFYELDRFHPIVNCLGLYEADISIVGDMNNILDRDLDEDIKLSNVKQIKLILEDEPLDRPTRKEKQEAEWAMWGRHVDDLRMKDEHIK